MNRSQARIETLESDLQAAQSNVKAQGQSEEELKESQARVTELEGGLKKLQAQFKELEADSETAQRAVEVESQAQEELVETQARVRALETDLERARSALQTAAALEPQAETLEAESRELRSLLSEASDRIQELETTSLAAIESVPAVEHQTLKPEQVLPMPKIDGSVPTAAVVEGAETQIFRPQVLEGGAGAEAVLEGDRALANLRDELRDLA